MLGAAGLAALVVGVPVGETFGSCTPVPVNPPSGYHASAADELCGVRQDHSSSTGGTGPIERIRIDWKNGYDGYGLLRFRSARAAAQAAPGALPDFARLGALGRVRVAISALLARPANA